jgi:hypothetical protein
LPVLNVSISHGMQELARALAEPRPHLIEAVVPPIG